MSVPSLKDIGPGGYIKQVQVLGAEPDRWDDAEEPMAAMILSLSELQLG